MIRTYILPCRLKRTVADAFNLASGAIYTGVLVAHWRIVRKKGVWLSEKAGTRLSDQIVKAALHAHTIDAAQQGFYTACRTARALKKLNPKAKYPHWTKRFRTTVWKSSALKVQGETLKLSNGHGNVPITIALPTALQSVLRFLEVRLVYDKKAHRYTWHVVVENGVQPKTVEQNAVVSVDLGEIHPAVVGDEHETTIILCRKRRHEAQGHAKRLASIARALTHKTKGSRRYKQLVQAKSRLKAKHERIVSDLSHKVSRAIVDVAVEHNAKTIVMGDIKDIANGIGLGTNVNQKISGWNHGQLRQLVEYKAEAEGITVELINEAYTSQTCPQCQARHKPRGRMYCCSACGFQAHRDVVGQINLLSRFKEGSAGKLAVPEIIKHRRPAASGKRSMRRCLDTGQPQSCSS
jgi:putative transposase